MKDPFKKLLANVKSTAKVRPLRRTVSKSGTANIPYEELPITITAEDLKMLFEKQGGRCAMLGTELDPQNIFIARHPLAPSVDRLDNTKGYELDNIQICSRFANFGKCAYPDDKMAPVIEKIKAGILSQTKPMKKTWWRFWA